MSSPVTTHLPHYHLYYPTNQPLVNINMLNTHQTSKHKWRTEKFWAFMLLGLNRTLYHDPLPPWGFESLIWTNCQAWWHYTHHGFDAKYEPQDSDNQADGESLSDEASLGERPNRRDSEDDLEGSGHQDSTSDSGEENVPGGDIPQPPSGFTDQHHCGHQFQRPLGTPHCPLCCTCADTGICALRCSCREGKNKTAGLLPRFDWERYDDGQDFGDLL